jgi:hypothetical protein
MELADVQAFEEPSPDEPSSSDPQSEVGTMAPPKPQKPSPAWHVDVSGVDFAGMAAEGRLSKLTVKELKSFLFDKDIPFSGNKADLVDRVSRYIADTEQKV